MAASESNYIKDFASLENLMAYGIGKPAEAGTEDNKPVFPMAGIGAPFASQELYNSFGHAPDQQPRSYGEAYVDALMPNIMGGRGRADTVPAKPAGPVLGPSVLPATIPASVSMTPPRYDPPDGNSNGQVDILRDAFFQVESRGQADPYIAKNPTTSASGKYQWIKGTWNNYGGYAEARFAPKAVQEARINEDIVQSLRKFNGDPFAVIANHMLPIQARKPWLWTHESYLPNGKDRNGNTKYIRVPPVIEYVQKAVKGTPYENELKKYMAAYVPR